MFRVTLRIWDSLPHGANGGTSGQQAQSLSDCGEIESLLTLLTSILKIFEVVIFNVPDCMIGLTAVNTVVRRPRPQCQKTASSSRPGNWFQLSVHKKAKNSCSG